MVWCNITGKPSEIGEGQQRMDSAKEAGLIFFKLHFIGALIGQSGPKTFRGFQDANVYKEKGKFKYTLSKDASGKDCASPDKVRFYDHGKEKYKTSFVVYTPYNKTLLAKMYNTDKSILVSPGKMYDEIVELSKDYPGRKKK